MYSKDTGYPDGTVIDQNDPASPFYYEGELSQEIDPDQAYDEWREYNDD